MTATTIRTNKYAGPCANCRQTVPAEVGSLTNLNGRWVVAHLGACPTAVAGAKIVATATVDPLAGIPTDAATGVKYSIFLDSGKEIYVEVKSGRGRWSGRTFMNRLVGAPGDWVRDPHGRLSRGQVAEYAAKIKGARYTDPVSGESLTGPRAAAVRFSRTHKVCAACCSPLSDKTQPGYVQGLGPVCVKKF